MNIVFMGTPDFAVPSLEALAADSRFTVKAVYTQPDKPVGRKRVLTPPDVKVCAEKLGLEVRQPESMRSPEVAQEISDLAPDVIVVIAYGKILPKEILDIPRLCCVNIHGSLLPKLRGAAPIQRAVIEGEEITGITSMRMDVGLDTGDMIETLETKICPDETAGELFDRLAQAAPDLLVKTLISLESGTAKFTKQDDSASTYAKPLSKEEAQIDWSQSAQTVHNKIRGMNPWPVAFTEYKGKKLKVFESNLSPQTGKPGEIISTSPAVIACGEGAVELVSVQMEGKKQMPAADFFRGQRAVKGELI